MPPPDGFDGHKGRSRCPSAGGQRPQCSLGQEHASITAKRPVPQRVDAGGAL